MLMINKQKFIFEYFNDRTLFLKPFNVLYRGPISQDKNLSSMHFGRINSLNEIVTPTFHGVTS